MDEYREILLKKASSSLPNWPKGPNDFYVAILSHEKHVRSCEHKDLLWLKVRGKHTVAQVRAFHNNRVGRKVLLCDGRDVVSDETQIRHLNYQRGEVVVFWTKLDDGRPPLAGLHTAAVNSRSRIDMGAHSVGPSSPAPPAKDVFSDLKRGLKTLNQEYPDSILKVEKGPTLFKVLCSECPHWTNFCPLQASSKRISDTIHIAEKHIATDRHKGQIQKKLVAINAIRSQLPQLYRRFPGSKVEVKVPPFGERTPWITCAACPNWIHKTFAGEVLSMTIYLLEKHLKSADHEDALQVDMEDVADPQHEENGQTADEENYEAEYLRLYGPESEAPSKFSDPDAMDVDQSPAVFPPGLTSKFDMIKVDGFDVLYCRVCRVRTTADAAAPRYLKKSNAEKHLATAKHQCAYLSNLMSDKAEVLQDSSVRRSSIGAFHHLMKQYLQECPLARLEFKPTGTQINTLQCTVCKGAGFHKYLFKNTVDSFTSASLRKAAHHLASKEHQASAEAADSGKSLVMETQPQIFLQTPNSLQSRLLQDAINVLEKDLSHPFHVKNTRSRVVKTYCTYCPTWSFTHRISHEDPATSVTTIKAMAQAHLASSLHIARLKTKIPQAETGFKKPNAQPMTQQITEAQFASVDRASQPRLATNFRGAEQSTSSLAESSPNILRPRLEAAIDEVRDQVSPRSSLYMVPAPSSSKRLEVKCNHCPDWYWAHSATLADVPRNFENTLAAVRMHLQSSHHTRALLLELSTGYSAGNEGKLELSPPISRKNKPSQQLAADTVKRVRSGTHEPQAPSKPAPLSSYSTAQLPSSSSEQTSESTLLAACKKWFPSKGSDIQKAFVKYTTGDIDCWKCEYIFENISGPATYMIPLPESVVEHVIEHMLGSSSQEDDDEQEDEDQQEEDKQPKPSTTLPYLKTTSTKRPAILPPAKLASGRRTPRQPRVILAPPKQHGQDLFFSRRNSSAGKASAGKFFAEETRLKQAAAVSTVIAVLKAKYPTSSFSFQRNEHGEECFTCHNCSRTLLSGACMSNFEQHLESAAHVRMVGRNK